MSLRSSAIGVAAAALAVLAMAPAVSAAPDGSPFAGRDRDFTLDAKEDLLSRKSNGQLAVSPHVGAYAYAPQVAINNGWNNAHWLSAGDVTGDAKPDVLAEVNGIITAHKHSGAYSADNPWGTLNGTAQYGGWGWNFFDHKVLYDEDGNGLVDVTAREISTGKIFVWLTGIENGQIVVSPAFEMGAGWGGIDQFDIADLNFDGISDWVVRQGTKLVAYYGQPAPVAKSAGLAPKRAVTDAAAPGAKAAAAPEFQVLSEGWDLANAFEIKDVNLDDKPDLLGRLTANGQLVAFYNTTTEVGGFTWYTGQNPLGTNWASDSFLS
ncbi:FG-GAP repeat protein [Amycolatopsis sp. YIM 10]|nr:FG-GAP repeat protein [Amycolatopsis sp. YIM 10]